MATTVEQILKKPEQFDKFEILNDDDRYFKAWGTVEIKDKDGELLPIDEFKKIMPVIMKRGGVIIDHHSNRVVGKILNYEMKEKSGKEGILLTAQIFKDYNLDDDIWNKIKSGEYGGVSFGGASKQKEIKWEKGQPLTILRGLEGYEWSVVEKPANPEATFESVNFLAKSEKEIEKKLDENEIIKAYELVSKPFAGFKDFADCISQNKDKEDPNAYCAVIMRQVEGTEKATQLPMYKIRGKFYFRDTRLGEYRNIDNPHDRIPIDDVDNSELQTPTEEDKKRVYGEKESKLEEGRKLLTEFERMIAMAELKALSNISLERPLNDKEYKRMMELKDKLFKGEKMSNEEFEKSIVEFFGKQKPPKEWWDNCVSRVKEGKPDYTDEQVSSVCGSMFFHEWGMGKSETEKQEAVEIAPIEGQSEADLKPKKPEKFFGEAEAMVKELKIIKGTLRVIHDCEYCQKKLRYLIKQKR